MIVSGMRRSLQSDAVRCLVGLVWRETLSDEDMQLLEGEGGFWDSQEGRDESLQGLNRLGHIFEALMRQGVSQRDPKLPSRVEVLLDFLKALFSVVVDIN